MKKRWLSALLCTAMVAGSMAGCGLKSPETATTAAPAATEAPAESKETEAAETERKMRLKRKKVRAARRRQVSL